MVGIRKHPVLACKCSFNEPAYMFSLNSYRSFVCLPAFFFLMYFMCICKAFGQTDAQKMQKMQELTKRQVGWDDARPDQKNPGGLHFDFAKIDETLAKDGHFERYRAYVHGAPENQKYSVGLWKIDQDLQILPVDVYVNAKGLLMVHKPRPEQENSDSVEDADELDFALQAARGEPIRFILSTPDGTMLVPGTIVPFPIESKGESCRIEARLVQTDAQAVLIYADGLKPNSTVPVHVLSAGDAETTSFSVNSRGHAASVDMPDVEGKSSGTLKINVDTKGCAVSIELPWGKGSYHLM
jgi:hypothetical protein